MSSITLNRWALNKLVVLNALLVLALQSISSVVQAEAAIYFIHNDHLGTPQVVTDENQNIMWRSRQKPFGEVDETTTSIDQNARFPGQYFDEETGYHYNYFRDYDPSIGRYIQSDPIGLRGGLNTYSYTHQNPVRFTDPYGLEVYVCGRPADLPWPASNFNHEWILTDTMEAGMGETQGVIPAQEGDSGSPLVRVQVVDHTGESYQDNARCDIQPDIDENCVNNELMLGRSLGRFLPPFNSCQSFVNEVINKCRVK